jgi:hypothetical protein
MCVGLAQESNQNLFTSVKPEATIKVQKHSMGADLIEITLLDANYPPQVLRDQIRRLGADLHSDPRGVTLSLVTMSKNDPGGAFLRANFAVDGVTDPEAGVFRLGPLVRSMTGAPAGHEIHGLAIIFERLAPKPTTLEQFGLGPNSPVSVLGRYTPGPIGLEYRVALNTQDPSKIHIPDQQTTVSETAPASPPEPPKTPWMLYAAIALFALAMGALVYSLTLRSSGPRPPRGSKNQYTGTPRHR